MSKRKNAIFGISTAFVYLLTLIIGKSYLRNDFGPVIVWWITLVLLGLVMLPLTTHMFRGFHDRGYVFSKVLGLCFSGFILWFLSSIKVLRFDTINGILCVAVILGINLLLYELFKKKQTTKQITSKEIRSMVLEELFILILFFICCYIKSYKPEASGTEKFMDYGFMTAIDRSKYMPPYDLWFSGGNINYYYFGQYLATFISKISFVGVKYGYNLMLVTIAVISFMQVYSICHNVMKVHLVHQKKHEQWLPVASGTLGAFLFSCGSNLYYLVFRYLVPITQELLGLEKSKYWFPDATRYIGYKPDVPDKTIHEFPAYSTILGDLHAHYINLIFVLCVIAILFAWLMWQENLKDQVKLQKLFTRKEILTEVINPYILMITFLIGLYHMTNYWDYPIYYVVSGAVILFSNLRRFQYKLKAWYITAIQGTVVLVGSFLLVLPFTINFEQISTAIYFTDRHSRIYQLLILWGLQLMVVVAFIIALIYEKKKTVEENKTNEKKHRWFPEFLNSLSSSDLFVLLMGLCAIGLVIMPEVIYVKDIYGETYQRANTMFKLTYQAFLLFAISMGYIIIRQIVLSKSYRQKRAAVLALILAVISLGYTGNAVNEWFDFKNKDVSKKTLDASAFLKDDFAEDEKAIEWLNQHVKGHAIVLEANGDSYSQYERVSVFTGLQTILGWGTHEALWRNYSEEQTIKENDIMTIYTSPSLNEIRKLVEFYDVDYIYVGNLEREKYGILSEDNIKSLGPIVYDNFDVMGEQNGTYIVKVDR